MPVNKEKMCAYLSTADYRSCDFRFRAPPESRYRIPSGAMLVPEDYPASPADKGKLLRCEAAVECIYEFQRMPDPVTQKKFHLTREIIKRQRRICNDYTELIPETVQVLPEPKKPVKANASSTSKRKKEQEVELPHTIPERDKMLGALLKGELVPQDIEEGVTVTGVEGLGDLDIFNEELLKASKVSGDKISGNKKTMAESMLSEYRKRGFYGSIRDVHATVIVNKIDDQRTTEDEQILFEYLAGASLTSTGRGKIAEVLARVQVKRKKYSSRIDDYSIYGIGIFVKNLIGEEGLIELKDLLISSRANWAEAQREAYRSIVSGGLPSLGKRR